MRGHKGKWITFKTRQVADSLNDFELSLVMTVSALVEKLGGRVEISEEDWHKALQSGYRIRALDEFRAELQTLAVRRKGKKSAS